MHFSGYSKRQRHSFAKNSQNDIVRLITWKLLRKDRYKISVIDSNIQIGNTGISPFPPDWLADLGLLYL